MSVTLTVIPVWRCDGCGKQVNGKQDPGHAEAIAERWDGQMPAGWMVDVATLGGRPRHFCKTCTPPAHPSCPKCGGVPEQDGAEGMGAWRCRPCRVCFTVRPMLEKERA